MSRAFLREEDLQEEVKVTVVEQPRQITPDGYQAFENELERLSALPDPPPDLEKRVAALVRKMKAMTIVEPRPDEPRAYFGAWVTVEDEDGVQKTYRLVGPDEVDAETGQVSINSPVARTLLGRKAGDIVAMHVPKGNPMSLEITAVDWLPPARP